MGICKNGFCVPFNYMRMSTQKPELIAKNGPRHRAQREKYMDNQPLESMQFHFFFCWVPSVIPYEAICVQEIKTQLTEKKIDWSSTLMKIRWPVSPSQFEKDIVQTLRAL